MFALKSNEVVALGLDKGEVRWKQAAAATAGLALDAERVFVAESNVVRALALSDGTTRWSTPLPNPVEAPLTAEAGWVLAVGTGGRVSALNAASGVVVWTQPLNTTTTSPPVVAGASVLLAMDSELVVVLDITTGAILWQRGVGGRPSQPFVLDGRVYVGSTDNFLYCFDERDGTELWRWRTGGDVLRTPVVDETRVYFASLDNLLRAIDRRNGNLRWKAALTTRAVSGLLIVGDDIVVTGLAPEVRVYSALSGRPVDRITVQTELLAGPPHLIRRAPPDGRPLLFLAGTDGAVVAVRQNRNLPLAPLTTLPGVSVPLTPPEGIVVTP